MICHKNHVYVILRYIPFFFVSPLFLFSFHILSAFRFSADRIPFESRIQACIILFYSATVCFPFGRSLWSVAQVVNIYYCIHLRFVWFFSFPPPFALFEYVSLDAFYCEYCPIVSDMLRLKWLFDCHNQCNVRPLSNGEFCTLGEGSARHVFTPLTFQTSWGCGGVALLPTHSVGWTFFSLGFEVLKMFSFLCSANQFYGFGCCFNRGIWIVGTRHPFIMAPLIFVVLFERSKMQKVDFCVRRS